ncbi:MAG: bifunctional metallophosphatase/5'-nucleotidase [Clostridia bacterium]|nr:bifunctional metallophosphatase/5'-nucleotidase [Clostridia bacterium]
MKKLLAVILSIVMMVSFSVVFVSAENEEIVILYENDVHCAVDAYAKLAAMKKELKTASNYVGVVSCGDYIQGSSIGAISQGGYVVELMNLVGYDAVTLGNHEFDYRIERLNELIALMNTKPVCSNFKSTATNKTVFEPYTIISYGDTDIAYIGVTTPDTITSSSPSQFLNDKEEYIYSFCGDSLYSTVQQSINEARSKGADYVIALTHLGTENVYEQWSAQTLVKNTDGLDAVLDGHSHSVVEQLKVKDKSGDEVVISSTGTKFANIGKLTIKNGQLSTELIKVEEYTKTDDTVSNRIKEINEEFSQLGDRKIGVSKVELITHDEKGNRLIRNTQTNAGDFCADAFRVVTGADIGMVNGGGIREKLDKGDITFNDILNIFPYNNRVVVKKVTGQQVVDMLELGLVNYPNEDGTFQHVSGLTFEIDKDLKSTVELDDKLMFVGVKGERRVKNVKVLQNGKYEDIDLKKQYTLASHNYLLIDLGGGATMFKDCEVVSDNGMLDVELLEEYITEHLNGEIGTEYASSQNRIKLYTAPKEEQEKVDTGDDTPVLPTTITFFSSLYALCILFYKKKETK